jgi:hypothetical protein
MIPDLPFHKENILNRLQKKWKLLKLKLVPVKQGSMISVLFGRK